MNLALLDTSDSNRRTGQCSNLDYVITLFLGQSPEKWESPQAEEDYNPGLSLSGQILYSLGYYADVGHYYWHFLIVGSMT